MGSFDPENCQRYIEVLPDVLHSYNGWRHCSKRFAPKSVSQAAMAVRKKMPFRQRKPVVWHFRLRDCVRLAKRKLAFEKEYKANFTGEIFSFRKLYQKVTFSFTKFLVSGVVLRITIVG